MHVPLEPETECPFAVGMQGETAEDRWMRAYRKFQQFRLDNSLSVSHFFELINDSGTSMLCSRAFCNNTISLIQVMSAAEMNAWAKEIQKSAKKIGFVCPADLIMIAKSYKAAVDRRRERHCHSSQQPRKPKPAKNSGFSLWHDEHSQFPPWLSQREDFRCHFEESVGRDCPSIAAMMAACAIAGCRRHPSQLALILRWMMWHQVLAHVSQPKLLDLCRKVKLLTVDANTKVVVQSSPGDAFYMVLSGRLCVEVNGTVVGALEEGKTFGERAIDSDSDRAATVSSLTECALLLIHASDYKGLAVSDRAVLNVELMNFVSTHCPAFRRLPYPDLYNASRVMRIVYFHGKQQLFQEGELCKGIYIVMTGSVHISRLISPVQVVKSNFLIPSMQNDKVKPFNVTVDQANLGPGSVFGEECLRERNCNCNNSATATTSCQLIFISACDVGVLHSTTQQTIIQETEALHADSMSLIFAHQRQLKRKMVLKGFRSAVLKPMLVSRLAKSFGRKPLMRAKFAVRVTVAGRPLIFTDDLTLPNFLTS